MGHIFQDEWWEKCHSGYQFQFIMAKEIGKGVGKGKVVIIGILLMKIMEVRIKGR